MRKQSVAQNRVPPAAIFSRAVFINNPLLIQVVGICPVVGAAVSLKTGALLAAVFGVTILVSQFIASAFLKKVPRWIRVALYLLIGMCIIGPAMYYLEIHQYAVSRTVGIYLPLMAVNSLTALRCEKVAVRSSVRHSVLDSLAVGFGYGIVTILVGAVREMLGHGEFAGIPISFLPQASGMLMPFGGFLVLGFAAAALRLFILRNAPERAADIAFEVTASTVRLRAPSVAKAPAYKTIPKEEDPLPTEDSEQPEDPSAQASLTDNKDPCVPTANAQHDTPPAALSSQDAGTLNPFASTPDDPGTAPFAPDDLTVSEDLAAPDAEQPENISEMSSDFSSEKPLGEDKTSLKKGPETAGERKTSSLESKSIEDLLTEMRFFLENHENGKSNDGKEDDNQ